MSDSVPGTAVRYLRPMKGLVFNLLEDLVRRDHGDGEWDALLAASGVSGIYTSLGNYPDTDLYRLVGAVSHRFGIGASDVVRWFGRESMPLLAVRVPEVFRPHTSTRAFVLTLNDIIHPEVRKLYPGADVPDFDFDASESGRLRMTYRSQRRLCAFAEGLIEGAARHYGERVEIARPSCMHRGDAACVLDIAFFPAAA